MLYLVSGHPRTRSAWLCALLNAHGSRCLHDIETNGYPPDVIAGVCDPGIAMLRPFDGIKACRGARVCITRSDWRPAFEKWSGAEFSDLAVQAIEENIAKFKAHPRTYSIDWARLDDSDEVARVIELCTQRQADHGLIRIFQQLKIEQHLEKAQYAYSVSMLESAT